MTLLSVSCSRLMRRLCFAGCVSSEGEQVLEEKPFTLTINVFRFSTHLSHFPELLLVSAVVLFLHVVVEIAT